jgi:hypothetical protein
MLQPSTSAYSRRPRFWHSGDRLKAEDQRTCVEPQGQELTDAVEKGSRKPANRGSGGIETRYAPPVIEQGGVSMRHIVEDPYRRTRFCQLFRLEDCRVLAFSSFPIAKHPGADRQDWIECSKGHQ